MQRQPRNIRLIAEILLGLVIATPRAEADPPANPSEGGAAAATSSVGAAIKLLVDQLRSHPAQPLARDQAEKHRLYLLDVAGGQVTLIADEPGPGLTHCGSARWSLDGKRILFDATPKDVWNQSHIFAIESAPTGPKLTDLGPGNCPSPSPDGKSVAFLLNFGAVPGAKAGVWIMAADGSKRQFLGSWGRPFWSPDGRHLLIVSFGEPCSLELMDVATQQVEPVAVSGSPIHSVPAWVDEKTLVATVGSGSDRAIALIDLTDPKQGKIREVVREKDGKPSVTPTYPSYSNATGRCVFVNANPKGMSLYAIEGGKMTRPRRLERDGFDRFIADLAVAPDGQYLIFCSDRTPQLAPTAR